MCVAFFFILFFLLSIESKHVVKRKVVKRKVSDGDHGVAEGAPKLRGQTTTASLLVLVQSEPVYVRSLVRSLRLFQPEWLDMVVLVEWGPVSFARRDVLATLAAGDDDHADAFFHSQGTAANHHVHVLFDGTQPETLGLRDAIAEGLKQLAAGGASSPSVLLVHDAIELFRHAPVARLLRRLTEQRSQGLMAVSGLLLAGDNSTVAHAGVEFAFAKAPGDWSAAAAGFRDTSNDDGDQQQFAMDGSHDQAVPHYWLRGVSRADPRVASSSQPWRSVSAATSGFLLARRADLEAVAGSVSDHDQDSPESQVIETKALAEADLSLRLLNGPVDGVGDTSSRRIEVYAGVPVGVLFQPVSPPFEVGLDSYTVSDDQVSGVSRDAALFEQRWGAGLRGQLRARQQLHGVRLTWNMECGLGAVLGFTTEALGLISALEPLVDIRVDVSDRAQCVRDMRDRSGLPRYRLDALFRMLSKNAQTANDTTKRILIIHRDPGRYEAFTWSTENDYKIGRSMFETSSIPADWIDKCNRVVDEVWVPSEFNVETFAQAGVNRDRLFVIPEPVDTFAYDSLSVERPLVLDQIPGLIHRGAQFLSSPDTQPLPVDFAFLAVGKWEPRKGYDDLLTAFVAAFGSQDSVGLYILTRLSKDEEVDAFDEALARAVLRSERPIDELPRITVINRLLPYSHLPALYAAVDAVVSATHGEGWGLPLIEAMSSGLPVLATNYSGLTQFLDAEAAIPIQYDKLVDHPDLNGHQWAQINRSDLQEKMVSLVSNVNGRAHWRTVARQRALQFSIQSVGKVMVDRLQSLLPTVTRTQQQTGGWDNGWGNNNYYNFGQSDQTKEGGRVKIKIND